MAAGQPLRSLLHFACPTVVDANGRRVPDSLPTMPSQALVARPPANWSAPAGGVDHDMGPTVHQVAGGWVVYYSTEDAATGGSAWWRPSPPAPSGPFTHTSSAPPSGQAHFGGDVHPSVVVPIAGDVALIWKNDGNARPASIWEQSLNPDRRSVTGRPVCLINADQAPVLSR
jgi:hypothetical protein